MGQYTIAFAMDKKDIFDEFAYDFELLQKMKSLLTQG